jgi:hypothetical protein
MTAGGWKISIARIESRHRSPIPDASDWDRAADRIATVNLVNALRQ